MLQDTYARVRTMVDAGNILVVGSRDHEQLYKEQLPDLPESNLLLEPEGLGTAPAIALTASREARRGKFDVLLTIPADHLIPEPDEWVAALQVAAKHAAKHDVVVAIGSIPLAPEIKFGYIVTGDRIGGTDKNPVCLAERFVEKPEREAIEEMLAEGHCLRNMGMLAFKPSVMVEEFATHLPEIHNTFEETARDGFGDDSIALAYSKITRASIDVALLQRSDRLAAVESTIKSIDTGDFASLGRILSTDVNGNAISGAAVLIDSHRNTIVGGDATIAAVGVDDLVIVVDGDTILICPKDQSQRIKEAADK